jgi:hypothetical protein
MFGKIMPIAVNVTIFAMLETVRLAWMDHVTISVMPIFVRIVIREQMENLALA